MFNPSGNSRRSGWGGGVDLLPGNSLLLREGLLIGELPEPTGDAPKLGGRAAAAEAVLLTGVVGV